MYELTVTTLTGRTGSMIMNEAELLAYLNRSKLGALLPSESLSIKRI